MFDRTDTEIAPWKIIKANRKTKARIDAIEHVLNVLPYRVEDDELLKNKELEQD